MTGTQSTVLRVMGVTAGYAQRVAIENVSFDIHPGTRVAVIGPNGGGKSTLFRVALGILRPWRGSVELFDQPADRLNRQRYPVAYVPQARSLDANFPVSARDVVAMGRVGRLGFLRFASAQDRLTVERCLDAVGLLEHADRPFAAFSGGQQQRILVARGLASEARLLLFDEPATGVDISTQRRIDEVIDGVVRDGAAVLISTHDLSSEHLARFDSVLCLNRTVLAHGSAAEVVNDKTWQQLFGATTSDFEIGAKAWIN